MAKSHQRCNGQKSKDKALKIDMSWLDGHKPNTPEPDGSFTVGELAKQENIKYNTAWAWVKRGLDAGGLEVVGIRRNQGNGEPGSGSVEKLYLSV